MGKNYYEVLGIPEDARPQDIRKAYRRLVIRFHPDRNSGSKNHEAILQNILQAYSVLSVPQERKKYDELLSQGRNPFNGAESQPNSDSANNSGSSNGSFSRVHLLIGWFLLIMFFHAPKPKSWSPPTLVPASSDSRSVGERFFENLDTTGPAGRPPNLRH